jgi:CubicO group peptidase (beta-lactamase class C family)
MKGKLGFERLAIAAACLLTAAGARAQDSSKIETLIREYARAGQINGSLLVARGDEIIYQGGFGLANMQFDVRNTVSTKYQVASMTKTLTAAMVMELVEKGKIALTDPIAKHLPDFPAEWGKEVTIEQLLTHTGGVSADIGDFPTSGNQFDPTVAMVNGDFYSLDEQVLMIAALPLISKPGEAFHYSSNGYAILGAIVAKVAGKPYDQALADLLFTPLGMKSSGYAPQTQVVPGLAAGYRVTLEGYEAGRPIGISPAGGAYSTVGDMWKFLRGMKTVKVLGQPSLDYIWRDVPYITAYGWKVKPDQIPNKPAGRLIEFSGALPGYNSLGTLTFTDDISIIILTNTREIDFLLDDITNDVLAVLRGEKPVGPKDSVAEKLARIFAADPADVPVEASIVWSQRQAENMKVQESVMNELGYLLMNRRHRLKSALAVFQWNVEAFPNSGNAYDSLGEVQFNLGDKAAALKSYQQAFLLDPTNTNAKDMITKLGG